MLWSQITLQLAINITDYPLQIILAASTSAEYALALRTVVPFTGLLVYGSYVSYSWTLAISLIVSCILLGVGFYGMYKAGGGAMGAVGLVLGIIGSIAGALLIILGTFTIRVPQFGILGYSELLFGIITTNIPSFTFTWIGLLILAAIFIVFGVASITARSATRIPALSVISGIVGIVGACLFFLYSMFVQEITTGILVNPLSGSAVAGIQSTIFGFIVIFVASILWSVLFYSTKTTVKKLFP